MLLKRLLKPNWRKSDADAAEAHTQAVDAADPGARRQACKTLTDLDLLRRISDDDPDAGVRDFAAARLRKLLAGDAPGSPDTQSAITYLQGAPDATLAAQLATDGSDPALRQAALALTENPEALYACALHDPVAAVRLAAAQRLNDKPALERLVKQIGRKDKNVLRELRAKLKAIAEREQAPERRRQQAEDLCKRIERLGRRGTWSQDKAVLEHSDRDWQGIEEQLPEPLQQRYRQARNAFLQLYEQQCQQEQAREQAEQAQQRLLADKQHLIAELSTPTAEPLGEQSLIALQTRWEALTGLPEADEKRQQRDWEKAWRLANGAVEQQRHLLEREQHLDDLCDQGRGWVALSAPLQRKELKRWMEQGAKLTAPAPETPSARAFDEVRQTLQKRLDKQLEHAEQKLEKLPERLGLLEQELEQGSLKPATALHQSVHADLELCQASGLPRERCKTVDTRLRLLTPRLRELQNWRKWGTDQHRQELLRDMQALESADLPLEALFAKVQELQQQWKALDHSGSPVNEGLWKRFHRTADGVFERCKPHLEQQAEQREAHRLAREALCRKLEDFLDQADWDHMDWKRAAKAEREIRNEWSNLGEVQPKQRKALEKRYHKLMKRLDQQLAGERATNKAFKQGLIEQARALVELPDLERAIHEIKTLQKQWHTTVAARRKQENLLWQHFREACDQVFARRDESRDAHRRELQDNAHKLTALCEELEAVGAAAAADPEDLLRQLHQLQGRWREETKRELARKDTDRLKRRWQSQEQELQQRIKLLRHAAERARMQQLAGAAELCRELETGIEGMDPAQPTAATWEQRWDELQLPGDAPPGLRRRFDAALKALTDDANRQRWLAKLEANAHRRAELCLQLEVATGIESPPEAAKERLALQVSRLAEHLGEGEADPLIALPRLELDWYQGGPAAAAHSQALEARFRLALEAATGESTAEQRVADPS